MGQLDVAAEMTHAFVCPNYLAEWRVVPDPSELVAKPVERQCAVVTTDGRAPGCGVTPCHEDLRVRALRA